MREIHCYCIAPLDIWVGVFSEKQLEQNLRGQNQDFYSIDDVEADRRLTALEEFKHLAKKGFAEMEWDGDIGNEGYFFLPGPTETEIGYIIKQYDNGTTYVASPERLKYLEEDSFAECVVETTIKVQMIKEIR